MTRAGEIEADKEREFAHLVTAHRRDLLRYAIRRLDDVQAAEDLTAETFIVVWRRWEDLPDSDHRVPWLFGIAHRLVLNSQRSQQRQSRLHARLAAERELEASAPRFARDDLNRLMDAVESL